MSKKVNDGLISYICSANKKDNDCQKKLPKNPKEPEEPKKNEGLKTSLSNVLVIPIYSNINNKNSLIDKIVENNNNNNNNNNNINQISKKVTSKNKIKIFDINKENIIKDNIIKKPKYINKKKKRHGANSPDNLTKTLIRHFIDFFFSFINFYIENKANEKKIELEETICFKKINCKDKDYIKIKDILGLKIEKFLLLESKKKGKNKQNDNKNDKKNNVSYVSLNKEELNKVKINFGSSLNNILKKDVKDLFFDIYYQNRDEINLEKYEIKDNLDENIQIFEDLKRKKDNHKIKLLEEIIQNKMISPKKKELFKTKKQ